VHPFGVVCIIIRAHTRRKPSLSRAPAIFFLSFQVPKTGRRGRKETRDFFFFFCFSSWGSQAWRWRRPSRAISGLSFGQLVDKTPGQIFRSERERKTKQKPVEVREGIDQESEVDFINLDSVPGRGEPSHNRRTVLDRPWPVRPRMARLPNNTNLSIGQMNKREQGRRWRRVEKSISLQFACWANRPDQTGYRCCRHE